MELTLDQLNKDKTQLSNDILKLVSAFQNKYSVGIYGINTTEARTMVQKFSQVVGIEVEVRL